MTSKYYLLVCRKYVPLEQVSVQPDEPIGYGLSGTQKPGQTG